MKIKDYQNFDERCYYLIKFIDDQSDLSILQKYRLYDKFPKEMKKIYDLKNNKELDYFFIKMNRDIKINKILNGN